MARRRIKQGSKRNDETPIPPGKPAPVPVDQQESVLDILLRRTIRDDRLPKDYATEIDHYLYGTPKRFGSARKANPRSRAKKQVVAKRIPGESLIEFLERNAVSDPSLPKDFSAELDHYTYGLPKRKGRKPRRSMRTRATTRPVKKNAAKKTRGKR